LNNTEKTYFQYSNDVARDNLYGYFNTAVFKEQVKDFNYYFLNNTGDGAMVMYQSKTVEGSAFYKFAEKLKDSVFFIPAFLFMSFAEIANDDNAMYYSYFFYLDNTSNTPYLSNGGATSADDTDPAAKNTFQKIFSTVSDWWAGKSGKATYIFWLIIGILAYAVLYKAFMWLGLFKNKFAAIIWGIITIGLIIFAIVRGLIVFGVIT